VANIISQTFDAKLHRAAWSKISREGFETIPKVHSSYLNVEPSSNALETDIIYSGLGAVPRVASDVVQTPLVDFKISPKVVYRHNEYRYQYVYTKVAADDDQYGLVTDVIGTMGEGAAFTMENVAAEILNLGTDAGAYATWDGLSVFNANHQLVGSDVTYSNITAASGPTYALLQTIYSYFRRVLNDQGFWTPVEIESIQCAPELAPLWRQLLAANAAHATLAYTGGVGGQAAYDSTPPAGFFQNANPGIGSVYGGLGLTADKVVENVYLTNTEDTFVIGRGKKAYLYMREAPNTDTYNIDDPKAMAHRIQMRFSQGVTDARRMLYIPGTGDEEGGEEEPQT
jgi:hypothetical protein